MVVLLALGWLIIDRRGPVVPPAILATALAALTLLTFVLPTNGFEPRKLVTPPVTEVAIANPLPQLAAWAVQGDAELFRMQDKIGTVEPGKYADLIVVNGDPLRNLRCFQQPENPRLVMKGGKVVRE